MTAEPTTRPAPSGRTSTSSPPPPAPAEPRTGPVPRAGGGGGCRATPGAARSAPLLFGCASLTPSLLPRGWVLQGLIAGVTAAIGYGVGVTVAWFVAELTESRMSAGFRRRAWQVLAVAGTAALPGHAVVRRAAGSGRSTS